MRDLFVGDCSRHPLYQPSLSPRIAWKVCARCGHVFTEGYYAAAACQLIYGATNAHQKVGHELEQHRGISARMIDKVLPYVASGRWLDVGFGNGSLLFTAREFGFMPVGLDIRADNVEKLRGFGIEAHCADIATLAGASRYAVISLADVLEHLPFPIPGLAAARRLLTADGVVLISMPNSDCEVWKVLDREGRNPYWGELEHYHNFSRQRLYALLRECGFEPLRYGVSERYRACMEVLARKTGDGEDMTAPIQNDAPRFS
jgi:SAM-dependent methyltransferase